MELQPVATRFDHIWTDNVHTERPVGCQHLKNTWRQIKQSCFKIAKTINYVRLKINNVKNSRLSKFL
jgi:hypothetical protein